MAVAAAASEAAASVAAAAVSAARAGAGSRFMYTGCATTAYKELISIDMRVDRPLLTLRACKGIGAAKVDVEPTAIVQRAASWKKRMVC